MHRRKSLTRRAAFACLISAWALTVVRADDTAPKEQEQPAAAAAVGQAQWLEAGGERFLGIYTKAIAAVPLGGAIILPGLDAHPDWPDVIAPLRQALPDYRWNTLAIQLPAPAQGADGLWQLEPYFTASRNRIQAAIAYLQQQGITNIVLIGHGLGAAAAAVSLSGPDPLKVSAFAAISLGAPPGSATSPYQPGLLEGIHIPILDIYGSRDLDEVTKTAAARAAAARRGELTTPRPQLTDPLAHPLTADLSTAAQHSALGFEQLELMGADHLFRGDEPLLIRRVAGWLRKHSSDRTSTAAANKS